MTADVFVSVLSPDNMGQLAGPSFEAPGEELFRELVSAPETVVGALTEDDAWAEKQRAIADDLARAPDKRAREGVKRRIPALVPGRFTGTRRIGSECLGRQVVMHDFDKLVADSFDAACERIRALLPDRFLAIHTTATERNEDGSWRLRGIELLDREATPTEWEQRVKTHMRSLGEDDKQALDIVRLMYMPVRTANYGWRVYEGPRTSLDSLPLADDRIVPPQNEAAPCGPGAGGLRDTAAEILGKHWPPTGQRADARLALVGACVHAGWSREDAIDFVCRVHAHVRDRGAATDSELAKMVDTALSRRSRGESLAGWSSLQAYVPAAVVSSARDLLNPDANAAAEFLTLVNRPAPEPLAALAPLKAQRPENGIFWDDWDQPLPPIEWLVEGLIPKGTVGGFVAHGSSLKTWTMLSIASAVAQGKAWLGKYPVKQGKVVVLDYESGRYELRRRVLLLEGGKVVGLGAWSYPTQRIDDVGFWKELAAIEDVALLCIDSLTEGATPGVDQNSPEAAFPLQLAARYTEETGASVLFIHHSKKDDGGDSRKVVRGSTAIYAAFDWCYAFENVEETTALRRMMMTSIKPCMGAKPNPVPLELTDKGLVSFDVAQKPTKASPPEQIQAAIRLALVGAPVESKAKIAQQIGIRREIVTPELDAMIVRREVVFLKGKGFALDSEEYRRGRVLEAVRGYQHWRSEGQIAKAADVETGDVSTCVREGLVCRSGDGRYLVVERAP